MSTEKEFLDSNTAVWAKLEEFEEKLDANTKMTQQVVTNTADLIEAFNAFKGVLKSLEFLGKVGRPIIWIGGAITILGVWFITAKSWIISLLK